MQDNNYSRLLKIVYLPEICAVSKISKKEIGRVFKLILKTLETNVEVITTGDFMVSQNYHYRSYSCLLIITVSPLDTVSANYQCIHLG